MKKVLLIFVSVFFAFSLLAQQEDSTKIKAYDFSAAVTVQSKGISTIPNLTLGKPAAIFNLKLGRKLTFEPEFRFSLEGKPWAIVFWWRYKPVISKKFSLVISANHALSFKTITDADSGTSEEFIRTTRYLVGALTPNYQINKYLGIGMYLFYARGIEEYITQNTYMVSFRPSISNIPITKNIIARIGPEVYYLVMDENEGVFFNARFSISRKNFPLSISALINTPLKSNIPSDYDFLWNLGLTYTFSKKYKRML